MTIANTLFGRFARTGFAAAVMLSALVVAAPATALADNGKHLGWYKNGKAEEKAQRKADKAARVSGRQVVVVNPNSGAIDRSRIRTTRPSNRNYGNTGNYRYPNTVNNRYPTDGWNGPIVYDYRTNQIYRQRYGSRASYPNYGYNPYGYGNSGYGNSGYGNYGYYNNGRGSLSSGDVAERARRSGYYAGVQRGQYDAAQGNRPNPQGHGAFQFGFDGFDPDWGSASVYQQSYRQAFIQGYNEGFSRSGYGGYGRRY